jgi:hypothetical protein
MFSLVSQEKLLNWFVFSLVNPTVRDFKEKYERVLFLFLKLEWIQMSMKKYDNFLHVCNFVH